MSKEKRCKECKKSLKGKNSENQFCNQSCFASFNNRGKPSHNRKLNPDHKCFNNKCNKIVVWQRKYCSSKCQNEYQFNSYIESWLRGEHNGSTSKTFAISHKLRRYILAVANNKCSQCGWCEIHKVTNNIPLQIHHLDGNYKNNKANNLQVLCPNCHSLTESFGSLNTNGRRLNGHM